MIISRAMKREKRRRSRSKMGTWWEDPACGHLFGLLPVGGPNTTAISTPDPSDAESGVLYGLAWLPGKRTIRHRLEAFQDSQSTLAGVTTT